MNKSSSRRKISFSFFTEKKWQLRFSARSANQEISLFKRNGALSADIFGTLISTGKLQKGGLNSIFLREKYCNANHEPSHLI
jgi:hypothetical protein